MEKVFVQVQFSDSPNDWNDIEVRECEFESRELAADWARKAAKILKAKIRLTYPSRHWEPSEENGSVQNYAGRLSGSYFSQ